MVLNERPWKAGELSRPCENSLRRSRSTAELLPDTAWHAGQDVPDRLASRGAELRVERHTDVEL